MADNEIKKALECCRDARYIVDACEKCPYYYMENCSVVSTNDALDLINRKQEMIDGLIAGQETLQKAMSEKDKEIEYLKLEYAGFEAATKQLIKTIQDEAIKEFAEKLKDGVNGDIKRLYMLGGTGGAVAPLCKFIDDINNLVKEMVGESDV